APPSSTRARRQNGRPPRLARSGPRPSTPISRRSETGNWPCDLRPAREPFHRPVHHRGRVRLVPAAGGGLLPAFRDVLLGAADRLLSRTALAVRPHADAMADRRRDAGGLLSFRGDRTVDALVLGAGDMV